MIHYLNGMTFSKLEQTSQDDPKLKVKIQSVSDDNVRKRFLEKPCFELLRNVKIFLCAKVKKN